MKAIQLESQRQIKAYTNALNVDQETRNYNASTNTTTILRSKEEAHDYRYFTEPDIPPVIIKDELISRIKKDMPTLPKERYLKYTEKYKLSDYDANLLTENKDFSDLFNKIVKHTNKYKTVANLMMGTMKSYVNENSISINEIDIKPQDIAELAEMIHDNKVSHIVVSQKLFPEMTNTTMSPNQIAQQKGWIQKNDQESIDNLVEKVIAKYPEKVMEYKNGNKNLLGLFMGEIMRETKGKLNPKTINTVLKNKLMQ